MGDKYVDEEDKENEEKIQRVGEVRPLEGSACLYHKRIGHNAEGVIEKEQSQVQDESIQYPVRSCAMMRILKQINMTMTLIEKRTAYDMTFDRQSELAV